MKKKTILLLITILPVMLFAQIEAGIGAGYSFKGSNPVANVYLGYRASIFSLDAEIRPPITRKANVSAISGLKFGIDLIDRDLTNASVIAGVGYYHDKKSADKTDLNTYRFGYSLKGIWYLKDFNGLYIETFYINQSVQLSFGMHATLN